MALCWHCRQIFSNDVLDGEWTINREEEECIQRPLPPLEVFLRGSEGGCFICRRSYRWMRQDEREWLWSAFELTHPDQSKPWYRLSISFAHEELVREDESIQGYSAPKFVVQPYNHAADMHGTAASSAAFTGSEAHIDLAHYWLSDCLSSHQCVKNLIPSWYPRRLLRILDCKVNLIETAAHNLCEPYATLSHCWGQERFLCLTTTNYAEFEGGIPRQSLPHTFRDAVDFAQRLGIRLIWIDCYCIIQSSSSPDATFSIDKTAEIAAMKDVYTYALINIGAAHGHGPHAGCFVEREPLQYEYRRFKWRPRASEQRNWFCVREDDVEEPNGLYIEQRLFHRAWVMQERLLTPRMIHFTDKHLYWECSERNLANDSFPEGMPEYGRQSNYARIWPNFSVEIDEKCDYLELWENMVRHYSKLGLSAPAQDKLVAIGAAAALVAGRSNDAYLAGHFRKELLRSLCWYVYVRSDVGPLQRLLESGAPSWSWSSMNGEILFRGMFNHEEPMASIEDVQVQLEDSKNPFGAVKSGKLLLKARMLDASIARDTHVGEHGSVKPRIFIEGIPHDVLFREVFSSREESDSFGGPLLFVPLLWKAHYVSMEEFLLESREDRAREASRDPECIVGVLLLRRADGCFVRLHLLEWASSELAVIWAAKKEELITWV